MPRQNKPEDAHFEERLERAMKRYQEIEKIVRKFPPKRRYQTPRPPGKWQSDISSLELPDEEQARGEVKAEPRTPRTPGGWEGKVWISEDFDAPLPDDLSP